MSSVTNAQPGGQYQIAVAKLQLEAVQQEGKNALALIDASMQAPVAAPPPNAAAGVGENLNIVA